MAEAIGAGSNLLVLDTHIWIWLVQGNATHLGPVSRALLSQAGSAGCIRVPAISVWEVGMLVAKGRLQLAMPCAQWVRAALGATGIALAPLSPDVALEATCLPGEFHGDPADRMVAATARRANAMLMTVDAKLLAYADAGYLRARNGAR